MCRYPSKQAKDGKPDAKQLLQLLASKDAATPQVLWLGLVCSAPFRHTANPWELLAAVPCIVHVVVEAGDGGVEVPQLRDVLGSPFGGQGLSAGEESLTTLPNEEGPAVSHVDELINHKPMGTQLLAPLLLRHGLALRDCNVPCQQFLVLGRDLSARPLVVILNHEDPVVRKALSATLEQRCLVRNVEHRQLGGEDLVLASGADICGVHLEEVTLQDPEDGGGDGEQAVHQPEDLGELIEVLDARHSELIFGRHVACGSARPRADVQGPCGPALLLQVRCIPVEEVVHAFRAKVMQMVHREHVLWLQVLALFEGNVHGLVERVLDPRIGVELHLFDLLLRLHRRRPDLLLCGGFDGLREVHRGDHGCGDDFGLLTCTGPLVEDQPIAHCLGHIHIDKDLGALLQPNNYAPLGRLVEFHEMHKVSVSGLLQPFTLDQVPVGGCRPVQDGLAIHGVWCHYHR
mmetsp:Transcript_91749/g.159132  ORF Transcript_91749/g.159132 Transcript_91749/m.159132 type:complete len:460 (-) Transcript_91749:17-1396(-)